MVTGSQCLHIQAIFISRLSKVMLKKSMFYAHNDDFFKKPGSDLISTFLRIHEGFLLNMSF